MRACLAEMLWWATVGLLLGIAAVSLLVGVSNYSTGPTAAEAELRAQGWLTAAERAQLQEHTWVAQSVPLQR